MRRSPMASMFRHFSSASRSVGFWAGGFLVAMRRILRLAPSAVLAVFCVSYLQESAHISAQSRELPVLLVHGFCSSSGTWSGMVAALQPSTRFGNGVTKLFASQGIVFQTDTGGVSRQVFPTSDPTKRLFAMDFFNDQVFSFDGDWVNDTGIDHKGAELSAVIKEVARIAGAEKVIVVAHSLGGLATRSYLQGLASSDSSASLIPYSDDIAGRAARKMIHSPLGK